MQVITIETPQLGDRSYLVHDGEVALVVDPQRDIDRVEAAAREAGVRITHVAETHIHNDYITGGPQLARELGTAYLLNGADEVAFDRQPVTDGDRFPVGSLSVRVLATPGHTHNHLAYLVSDGPETAVFTGGSLLYGSVGRTDLAGAEHTEYLTHAQYRSARRLVAEAAADTVVYPTHGFGSFCSSGPATVASRSTVGEQQRVNHALTDADEDHFVEQLIANLTAYPSYYAHMSPLNRKGPDPVDLSVPAPLSSAELRARIEEGQWVVDLRDRVAFARKHLRATVSFEYGTGAAFTTFLGWTLPWGDAVTLVGSRAAVAAAIRDLSRIGIDSLPVATGDEPEQWAADHPLTSYPRVGWAELAEAQRADHPPVVLDVRRSDEWDSGHLEGAVHLPLHELVGRIDELPGATLWVHCGSGYRAGIAASILHRAGHDVVHIDADWSEAGEAGVALAAR